MVDPPAPETIQVPVGSVYPGDVGTDQKPGTRTQPTPEVMASASRVVESDSAARAIDLRQRRPRNHHPGFIVERIPLAECDHYGIGSRRAQRPLCDQRLRIFTGEV